MAGTSLVLIRIVTFVASIILLALMTIAALSLHKANSLPVPVPTLLKTVSIALPIAELFAVIAANIRVPQLFSAIDASVYTSGRAKLRLYLEAILVFWLSTILDSYIISSSSILQKSDALTCNLEQTWAAWFQEKDSTPIRSIQDDLECCGLRSIKDRAWPFPDAGHGADACAVAYRRNEPCLTRWEKEAQSVLTSFVVIGFISLALKVLIFGLFWQRDVLSVSRSSWRVPRRSGDSEHQRLLPHRDDETESSEPAQATHATDSAAS